MEWDQVLFKKAWNWLATIGQPQTQHPERASLEQIHVRLSILARMLCGDMVEVLRAEQEGGWSANCLFLPESFELGRDHEQNLLFYLFRVTYLSIQRERGLNWSDVNSSDVQSLTLSRQQARESSPEILEILYTRFPAMADEFQDLIEQVQSTAKTEHEQALLWGHWLSSQPFHNKLSSAIPDLSAQKSAESELTTHQAPAREQVEIEHMDKAAMEAYTLQHQFEKVETLEEFQGTWRDADGSDELDSHADALQEVDLRKLTRSDDMAHSVLQAEFTSQISVPDVSDQILSGHFITYDEWDHRRKEYRRDWCKVYPRTATDKAPEYVKQTLQTHRSTLQSLRRRYSQQLNQWQNIRRQPDGYEPDLDAMVNFMAERHAGQTPGENIYLSQRRQLREVSLILLMDLSLSSDAYTGGHRVLDVEKQSVILFAELLSEWGDRFQIDGFASHTRNQCEYITFKSFDEPWLKAAPKIGAAEPRAYTRIGPALRHATSLLAKESSRSRWILLLSDGKPNDYDRYEGQYGLADVRQSIREARSQQIQVYALAIESLARNYLPLMLGTGGYRILPQPALLPEALGEFYGKLLRT